ncbi:MAG: phosphotransferase [Alphaproteobacteria bacterium]
MRDYKLLFSRSNKQAPPLTFLAGDASLRRYYRFWEEGQPYVLMDAPAPENPQRFCELADFLCSLGLSAPRVFQQDLDQGYLVLEDLGDQTFTRCLDAGHDPEPLYNLAIDVLIELHSCVKEPPLALADFTPEDLVAEVALFFDWYWPEEYGHALDVNKKEEILGLWNEVFTKALASPKGLVLRDFHVDNLIWLEKRAGLQQCGLLDFQDAVWGPKVYDIISLFEDARRDLPTSLVTGLWQRYCAAFPEDNADALLTAATVLSAGRHLKIIGIFTRLHVRDGKLHYLAHIPRVWRLLHQCLEHPALVQIKQWFHEHLPTY